MSKGLHNFYSLQIKYCYFLLNSILSIEKKTVFRNNSLLHADVSETNFHAKINQVLDSFDQNVVFKTYEICTRQHFVAK